MSLFRKTRLQTHHLADQLSVTGQVQTTNIQALSAQGFRGIINNRPDGEEGGQPPNAVLEAAAHQAGMEWRHIAVSGRPDQAQVDAFAAALKEMPGPILAFCRSGKRSSMLWALQAEGSADAILHTARTTGYDLSLLRPWLGRAELS